MAGHTGQHRRLTLVLLLVSMACRGADSGGNWTGTVETLPNGAVRVTNPPQGLWVNGSGWRLVSEFVLGEVEGDGAEVFAAISGIEVDPDGRIYVLDRQANELRIFGPEGSHIRSVGRSGAGPGEYANANGLTWVSPDTLLIVDQRGNRYTLLTRDGSYVRSVPRQLGFFGWVFSGGYQDGRIYEISSVGQGEVWHPVLLGTLIQRSGPSAVAARGTAVNADEPVFVATGDTTMLPEPNAPLYESFSVNTDRGGMVMGVPFTARPVYYLDGLGSIWHGHGSEFRIYRSTFEGDTLSEIVLEGVPSPVTPVEVAEWEASSGVERFRAMGGKLDLGRIPKAKPYFDDIFTDSDGNVWLAVPAAPAETVFDVLDPDGRYLGRLEIDGVTREPFLHAVARGGRLYMVGKDELDVQRVYVYRVEK